MTTQNKNVPALRFPEFSEDWEGKTLGELFNISAGGDIDKENLSVNKNSIFKYPVYSNSERDKGLFGFSDKYRIEKECVTVSGRGTLGKAFARFEKFYPIVRLLVLIPKKPSDVIFYENTINRINFFVESTGVPQLTAPQISNYKVSLPQLPEQQKIAAFLTAVDEKIQQLAKKKDLLEQYKKGVMQKIFNQEIRFKDSDGNDFADWEEKKLSEVCNINKGEQLNASELTLVGDYPALNGGINPSGYTDDWNKKENTITISEGGNSCGYVNFITQKFWCGGHCYALENLRSNINNLFLYQILKHNESAIMRLRVGSGLPNIQKKDVNNFPIQLPKIDEQNKIAAFLSAIDDKINLVNQQLEKTKEYKKGLLQQMFV